MWSPGRILSKAATVERSMTSKSTRAHPNAATTGVEFEPADAGASVATLESAWTPDTPDGEAWTPRPWVHAADRIAQGKSARKRVPRASHAGFVPREDRDPIAILDAQEADRLPQARAAASPAHGGVGVRLLPRHARGHGL